MGWLYSLIVKVRNFLKSKPELERISLSELKNGLTDKSKEVMALSNYNVKEHSQRLKEKRWLLECYLDEWSKKSSSEQVQKIFKKTREVLEQIVFPDEDLGTILLVNLRLNGEVESLITEIEETDFSHNFAFLLKDEERVIVSVNPLLKELIELESIRESFERVATQSGLRKIEVILKRISKLQELVSTVSELKSQIQNKRDKLKATKDRRQQKEFELQQLREDQRYGSIKAIENKKTELERRINEQKQAVLGFFEDLKSVLQQYSHFGNSLGSDEKVNEEIDLYLSDAYTALINDGKLTILEILTNCKAALLSNKFNLDAEEAQTILTRLRNFEILKKWQSDNLLFNSELDQLANGSRSDEKEFITKRDDIKYRLDHFIWQEERVHEETMIIESKESELSEEIIRNKDLLQNLISISLNRKVEIIT